MFATQMVFLREIVACPDVPQSSATEILFEMLPSTSNPSIQAAASSVTDPSQIYRTAFRDFYYAESEINSISDSWQTIFDEFFGLQTFLTLSPIDGYVPYDPFDPIARMDSQVLPGLTDGYWSFSRDPTVRNSVASKNARVMESKGFINNVRVRNQNSFPSFGNGCDWMYIAYSVLYLDGWLAYLPFLFNTDRVHAKPTPRK